MKRLWKILASAAALAIAAATPALAQVKLPNGTLLPERPFFIVTYIEAAPAEAQKVADMIRKHGAATRQKAGNIRSEGLQENGRKNHFVVLEVWQDQAARAGHAKSDETIAFRKALHALLHRPYDERPHAGLEVTGGGEPAGRAAFLHTIERVRAV